MKNTPDLKKIFGKFAGKELKDPNRTTRDCDDVLDSMKAAAKKNGLHLRMWFPGTIGTMELRLDRVNAHVKQGKDGKFRVSNRFEIG